MGINRREFLSKMGVGALGMLGSSLLSSMQVIAKPSHAQAMNVILFLIDDLGWRDPGCYGNRFHETPNIDRIACEGMRFTNAYSACTVCSPTRASILSGKYPARLHLTDWIPGHRWTGTKLIVPQNRQQLPLEEVTIAEAVKSTGYRSASIGKWHLGFAPYAPDKNGFDVTFANTNRGGPGSFFYPYKDPDIPTGEPGEYLTDRLTDEAVRFLQNTKNDPFVLYFPHHGVHGPVQGKQELVEKYRAKNADAMNERRLQYAAMMDSVDQSVGRVYATLKELGILDRTVIIFGSDNGGERWNTSNLPLRAGKGSLYEGGIRVPLIIRWPGVVKPGSISHVPTISMDLYPTILEMTGVKPDRNQVLDGVSIAPVLKGSGGIKRESLFWHYPHYLPGGYTPCGAVRKGDFKLIEFYEDSRLELYNLNMDIGEKVDLSRKMPEKTRELHTLLDHWRMSVSAEMPVPNPDYNPAIDPSLHPELLP